MQLTKTLVNRKQGVFSQWMMIPRVFLAENMKLEGQRYNKIALFLSSPFAMVKDKVMEFITLNQPMEIDLYLSSDSDLIINNNVLSLDVQQNVDRLVFPLVSVVDYLNSASVHVYSLNMNSIPLFYCNYARSSLVLLTDSVNDSSLDHV